MNTKEIKTLLTSIESSHKENRKSSINIVLSNPKLIENLILLSFDTKHKLSAKCARVLELVCVHHNINYILPYLDLFCDNLHKLENQSTIRAFAKICEILALQYTSKEKNEIQQKLNSKHIKQITETGFDWLISDQKIAVNAYTMQTLYIFGKYIEWIHPELEYIIKTKTIHQSKATEARGKKILKSIQKFKRI